MKVSRQRALETKMLKTEQQQQQQHQHQDQRQREEENRKRASWRKAERQRQQQNANNHVSGKSNKRSKTALAPPPVVQHTQMAHNI
jgi:hypothetical protein